MDDLRGHGCGRVADKGGGVTKAATRGDWNQVSDSFDKRQQAKGAVAAANEDGADDGEDMFARAGVAAE